MKNNDAREVMQSLYDTMVFDSRDWANDGQRSAWIFGVVVGWGDALDEVADQYGWDQETRARIERLHRAAKSIGVQDPGKQK